MGRRKKAKITGYVLWRGASLLRGTREVVCIVTTGKSKNRKTGQMPQVWILDANQEPHLAYRGNTAAGQAMCGDCKHKDLKSCYVQWHNAPLSIYRKFKRGGYPRAPMSVWRSLIRRGVRMGAAGDPAAIPAAITRILKPATAYTHQWKHPQFQVLRGHVMASVDTPQERSMARALGWRCFEVTVPGDTVPATSIVCPTEYRDITCDTCRLCAGTSKGAKDITIPVHGPTAKRLVEWRRSPSLAVLQ